MHDYFYNYTARTYEYIQLRGEEFGAQNGEWFSVPMYAGQKKLQSDQQRLMGQLKGIFYLPAENTLNTGLEYRYDYLKAPERTETGTASDWTAAVYAQDEFNALKWLNVTGGLRLVRNQNYGFRLTPKLSAMLSAGDFRFRLGWSQGFKSPTVKELHYRYLHVMGSSTFFNIGNTSLKPQTSNYFSANAEYRGNRLAASVTGYLNRLDNMIALTNVPVGEIPAGITTAYLGDGSNNVQARMYKNMDDARTWGIDVTLSYKILSDLSFTSAYSYLDTKAHLYDTAKNRMEEVIIDGTAHHKWSASLVYGHAFSGVKILVLREVPCFLEDIQTGYQHIDSRQQSPLLSEQRQRSTFPDLAHQYHSRLWSHQQTADLPSRIRSGQHLQFCRPHHAPLPSG